MTKTILSVPLLISYLFLLCPTNISPKTPSQTPITFLALSDTHLAATTEDEVNQLPKGSYPKPEKQLARLNQMRPLRKRMLKYIKDPSKNIRAVIMAGDNAGGYGNRSDTKAFKTFWYNPFTDALKKRDGQVLAGIGNHDTYWWGLFQPKPTAMLKFIRKNYDKNYLYSRNIGPIHVIHLAQYPAINAQGPRNVIPPSLPFLKNDLKQVSKKTPVIIFFHYPIHGHMSDWWSKREKDLLWDTIKDYNVIAIIVGHSHRSAMYMFRSKIPVVQAASSKFAAITWDPYYPKEANITFVDATDKKTSGKDLLKRESELDKKSEATTDHEKIETIEDEKEANELASLVHKLLKKMKP